jgi:hypothetical protein
MFGVPDRPAACPEVPYQRQRGIVSTICKLGRAYPGNLHFIDLQGLVPLDRSGQSRN